MKSLNQINNNSFHEASTLLNSNQIELNTKINNMIAQALNKNTVSYSNVSKIAEQLSNGLIKIIFDTPSKSILFIAGNKVSRISLANEKILSGIDKINDKIVDELLTKVDIKEVLDKLSMLVQELQQLQHDLSDVNGKVNKRIDDVEISVNNKADKTQLEQEIMNVNSSLMAVNGFALELSNTKADKEHTHEIANINGLQDSIDTMKQGFMYMMDDKADKEHTHTITEINELQNTLNNKANKEHTHTEFTDIKVNSINGCHIASTSALTAGVPYPYIPVIKKDGVMEVGKYIDMHDNNTTGKDSPVRLTCTGNSLNCNTNFYAPNIKAYPLNETTNRLETTKNHFIIRSNAAFQIIGFEGDGENGGIAYEGGAHINGSIHLFAGNEGDEEIYVEHRDKGWTKQPGGIKLLNKWNNTELNKLYCKEINPNGNILFKDTQEPRAIEFSGGSDGARIMYHSKVKEQGELEIATADDGNEPIYVRQYQITNAGRYGSVYHEAILLDSSGHTTFPGELTARDLVLKPHANYNFINATSADTFGKGQHIQMIFGDAKTQGILGMRYTYGSYTPYLYFGFADAGNQLVNGIHIDKTQVLIRTSLNVSNAITSSNITSDNNDRLTAVENELPNKANKEHTHTMKDIDTKSLIDLIYPIGSVITLIVKAGNPNDIYPNTTWEVYERPSGIEHMNSPYKWVRTA